MGHEIEEQVKRATDVYLVMFRSGREHALAY
jgi:hypothetical protein